MMELLFASNNIHKLSEIRDICGNEIVVKGLADIGMKDEIPEDHDTLEGNASQKAWYVYNKTGLDCFADDTGLFIDALEGRPGVYSARYAGEGCTFDDNVRKVLDEMKDLTNRNASFRCVVCLIMKGKEYLFEGVVSGIILKESQGTGGFGYDPVFLPSGQKRTFSEMPAYLKNGISHRAKAVGKMLRFLKQS